jgi:outer membrane lipoprotein-sorting protein
MGKINFRHYGVGAGLLLFAACAGTCQQSTPSAALSVEQIVDRLQKNNAERAAALSQYEGTRVYRMEYRGFPSDRNAEMVVKVVYHAPNSKEFSVVSQTGSKFIIDHVFKKLLEGEQEASNEENRIHTALSAENYNFTSAGFETAPDGGRYVLNLFPKTKNKFLYRGKIWVDAKDFAVVQIQGEPSKNPSFWIKKTEVEHKYVKVGGFWLPAENHTESMIRIGGVAILSIEYKDYRITKAALLQESEVGGGA